MPTPAAVSRWVSSVYPTLALNQQWLAECCDYVQESFANISPPQLIKKVEEQILLASLSEICDSGALPTENLSETLHCVIGDKKILVQVVGMTEVGHSAQALKDTHEQRKEEARITAKGGQAERTRVVGNLEGEEEVNGKTIKFPRAMLSLQLSDGFTTLKAIECKRIPGLSLEETPLGCKLLLKEVKTLRGIMLLTPEHVTIKGMQVPELDANRHAIFEADLHQRLGLDPPEGTIEEEADPTTQGPPPQPRPQPHSQRQAAVPPRPQQATNDHADLLNDIDFDADESFDADGFGEEDPDFLAAVQDAEQQAMEYQYEEVKEEERMPPRRKVKKEVIDLSLSSD